jgi:dTDP-4-amino-4,6-dideoxygalactose transaminase
MPESSGYRLRPEPRPNSERIPVLRPRLPSADRLLPYLRRIDDSRWYTNWGPLASELEQSLARHFGLSDGTVVSAASGTAALVGAILSSAGRATAERPIAIVPAFTFIGTASAVEQCGYRVQLADVAPDHWMLDAGSIGGLDRTGLVVVVSPFGRPVVQETWLEFRRQTNIPVVIDGAASFEALSADPAGLIGDLPIALSFHAAKAFACGEGGCVIAADPGTAVRVTSALNFGFYEDRQSRAASINGKMSEYHAAVALAELDAWPDKQRQFRAMVAAYQTELESLGLAERLIVAPGVASCYVLFRCRDLDEAARVEASLSADGIEFRYWYGGGLHAQPHFAGVSRATLINTDQIAPLLMGLPVATDLSCDAVARVARALADGIAAARNTTPFPERPIEAV